MTKDERIRDLELKLARAEGERDEARRQQPVTVAPYYPSWHVLPTFQPWCPTVTVGDTSVGNTASFTPSPLHLAAGLA